MSDLTESQEKICELIDNFSKSITLEKVCEMLESMKRLLLEKNKRYGDSALKPVNVFSKDNASNGICIRLDDKLNRIKNAKTIRKNDAADIMGYLVLLCVSNGWTSFDELID